MTFINSPSKLRIKFPLISCCCITDAQSQRQCLGQTVSVMCVFRSLSLSSDSNNLKSNYMLVSLSCSHRFSCWNIRANHQVWLAMLAQGHARTLIQILKIHIYTHSHSAAQAHHQILGGIHIGKKNKLILK